MVEYSSPRGLHRDPATTLGAGGLFIETESPLHERTPIKLCFQLPGAETRHEIEGRVVWCSEERDGRFWIGLEMMDEAAPQRIG